MAPYEGRCSAVMGVVSRLGREVVSRFVIVFLLASSVPARRLPFLAPYRRSFLLGGVPPAYPKSSLVLWLLRSCLLSYPFFRLASYLHIQSVEVGQGETHHPKE
jgi:hypothetical protein